MCGIWSTTWVRWAPRRSSTHADQPGGRRRQTTAILRSARLRSDGEPCAPTHGPADLAGGVVRSLGAATAGDLPARQGRKPVESRAGAGASGSRPSRFLPPLVKPDVPISGIRLSDWLHRRTRGHGPLQASNTQRAEHPFLGELAGALRGDRMPPSQKMPYAVIDILVHCPISLGPRAIAKVVALAASSRVTPCQNNSLWFWSRTYRSSTSSTAARPAACARRYAGQREQLAAMWDAMAQCLRQRVRERLVERHRQADVAIEIVALRHATSIASGGS
jgi:hypothetical protein